MKQKQILLYTILFFGMFIFGFALILSFSTSMTISQMIEQLKSVENADYQLSNCTDTPALTLDETNGYLKKLNEYQKVCNSYVTNELMLFIDMPKDSIVAKSDAAELSKILKELHTNGISPLVIVEPVTDWGLIDFKEFDTGFYDEWINSFFIALKTYGIDGSMMGTWVPFPEANLPFWNRANATPAQFGSVVNRYLRILKKHYPAAQGSILLNSATYESTDFEWANGEYLSLIPYVEKIDKSLIDSFGIQGFPWRSDATHEEVTTIYNPQEFINPPLAMEAANYMSVKSIWINTGSFSSKYTLDPKRLVFIDPSIREEIMQKIISQALRIKDRGFKVKINLFSEDKSATEEATNWSYWGDYQNLNDPNIYIFKGFIKQASDNQLEISLFDKFN